MKLFALVLLTTLALFVYSQNWAFYAGTRQPAGIHEPYSPATLAAWLTATDKTDMAKVRSIFFWITDNISYKVKPGYAHLIKKKQPPFIDDDTSLVLKSLNERVAENVLKTNEAVCDGYSRLFVTLCNYANIQAEVITGYSRTGSGTSASRFKSNHSWNAVRIDSVWYLLDVTWASGYVNYSGDQFIKNYSSQYFLAAPKDFVYEHYPENLQWALLADPPTLKEFNNTPFKTQRFIKSGITAFMPQKGIIESAVGDTIQIEIQTTDTGLNLEGTYDPSFDSISHSLPASWAFVTPEYLPLQSTIQYRYIVQSANVQWLNVVLHDEVLMRYRLLIKPRKETCAVH